MIQSMTGFATKSFTLELDRDNKANVSMNLKSLNSRYFEINCKFPQALSPLETELTRLCKKKLLRGYVSFTIFVDNVDIFKGAINPSLTTIASYLQAINQIKKQFNLTQDVTLEQILELPNIFITEEKTLDQHVIQTIIDTTNELIKQVIKERKKEGKALKKDLEQRIVVMQQNIKLIEQRSKKLIEEQKVKVNQVLQELQGDESELAEARKSALYAILDKIDIHEEVVRFKSHLENIHDQLESADVEKGKRLDFTLQELAREINTIAAKCSDAMISTQAINTKVEIEKAREQAQNLV